MESELINHEGLTQGMLVTLGEQKILKLEDFADLASDELTGGYAIIKCETVRIKGYLEDLVLSKKESDEYFWILGRADDILKVAGHRIGTAELESSLVSHDDVVESAVCGIPDEIKVEDIVALEVLKGWC